MQQKWYWADFELRPKETAVSTHAHRSMLIYLMNQPTLACWSVKHLTGQRGYVWGLSGQPAPSKPTGWLQFHKWAQIRLETLPAESNPTGRSLLFWRWCVIQQKLMDAGRWWLIPVMLATWEAEIRSFMVQGQPGHIVQETSSPK
jgi:hypothetical protein